MSRVQFDAYSKYYKHNIIHSFMQQSQVAHGTVGRLRPGNNNFVVVASTCSSYKHEKQANPNIATLLQRPVSDRPTPNLITRKSKARNRPNNEYKGLTFPYTKISKADQKP